MTTLRVISVKNKIQVIKCTNTLHLIKCDAPHFTHPKWKVQPTRNLLFQWSTLPNHWFYWSYGQTNVTEVTAKTKSASNIANLINNKKKISQLINNGHLLKHIFSLFSYSDVNLILRQHRKRRKKASPNFCLVDMFAKF